MSGNKMFNRFAEKPQTHVDLTPDDDNDLNRLMMIYVESDPAVPLTIAVHDANGTALTYTIGEYNYVLPILVRRVLATGTTATVIYGIY